MTIEVFTPRWRRALQVLFASRGGAGGQPLSVLDDVMPTVELADASQSEFHFNRGEVLFSANVVATSAGGNFPSAIIGPLGSYLVVIERLILVSTSAAGTILVQTSNNVGPLNALSSTTQAQLMDQRNAVPTSVLVAVPGVGTQLASSAIAPTGPCIWRDVYAAAITSARDLMGAQDTLVLPPGAGVVVQLSTAASTIEVIAHGYVRTIDPAELQPNLG